MPLIIAQHPGKHPPGTRRTRDCKFHYGSTIPETPRSVIEIVRGNPEESPSEPGQKLKNESVPVQGKQGILEGSPGFCALGSSRRPRSELPRCLPPSPDFYTHSADPA